MEISKEALRKLADAIAQKTDQLKAPDTPRNYLGGSEITGCKRKTVALHLGIKQTDPRSYWNSVRLRIGDLIEESVVNAYKQVLSNSALRLAKTGDDQLEISPGEPPIKLHPDGVFVLNDQPIALLEVKSAGERSFEMQAERPHAEYIGQVTGEMHYSKIPFTIMHIARVEDPSQRRIFVIPYNEEVGEWFHERANTIYQYIRSGELPDGEPSALCNYCAWRSGCPFAMKGQHKPMPEDVEEHLVKPTKDIIRKVNLYLDLADEQKRIKSEMDAIRKEIIDYLESHNATGLDLNDEGISCKLTKPIVRRELDKDKVLELVPADILAECYKVTVGKPSLRIQRTKAKTATKATDAADKAREPARAKKPQAKTTKKPQAKTKKEPAEEEPTLFEAA